MSEQYIDPHISDNQHQNYFEIDQVDQAEVDLIGKMKVIKLNIIKIFNTIIS